VKRVGGPAFMPVIDGTPKWRDIEGTPLRYVFNSETPIIKHPDGSLYALSAGIWFTAYSLDGSWSVATSVLAVIYIAPGIKSRIQHTRAATSRGQHSRAVSGW
jgi:hypothetical protein